MNLHLPSVFAAIGCVLIASCSPYNENKDKKPTQKPSADTAATAEQQKAKKQQDALKEKQTGTTSETSTTPDSGNTEVTAQTSPPPTNPPVEEKRPEWKFANKVPGKDGYVFSPYNNKVVDVKGIPSGTLVQDPTYTGAGKGYFRVP